ncbi:MAG: AraC family transcriptional regulator [Bifidobacteriaceae bacterium]|jgi:AraC-like DNA-binding protein|nr:AraC family transcriptional regulator [Bifidobacteriaceae bacterium]MCI1914986.1 AraC family transcriptional regulator [Bifidobacteriaceae bacterium]
MGEKNYSVFTRLQESFFDLRIYQFGQERCVPMHLYGPVKRNHYLFHYVLNGTGVLQYSDSKDADHSIDIHQNEGFLIFPNQETTYFADKTNPWEYIWIEFDGIQAEKFVSQVGLSRDYPRYAMKDTTQSHTARRLFSSFIAEASASDYQLLANLYLTFDELIKRTAHKPELPARRTQLDSYVGKVQEFIEANYSYDVSVDDIARHCGLNKNYLGRIFKRETSKSIHNFLLEYRLSRAAQLLEESDTPVKNIAHQVGYKDPFTFSRIFREKYGLSPNKWRNQKLPSTSEKSTTLAAKSPSRSWLR